MRRKLILFATLFAIVCALPINVAAQEGDLNIFGYFQAQVYVYEESDITPPERSFNLQQLNLFFQKTITDTWSSYANVEITNSFSSSLNTGKIALEEAWGRYSKSDRFSLKIGLLIPTFNNLNTMKNRTPILPYIDRPLAYEASMASLLPIAKMVPGRAYVEASGVLSGEKADLDYAVFVGNGPNLAPNGIPSPTGGEVVSGVDSTTTFMIGGRLGLRYNDFKAGVSGTIDKSNEFSYLSSFEATRKRFGADVSGDYNKLHFEAEYMSTNVNSDGLSLGPQIPLPVGLVSGTVEADYTFYYASMGFNLSDDFYVYGLYNYFEVNSKPVLFYKIIYPSVGFSYTPNYRVKFKVQIARADVDFDRPIGDHIKFFRSFAAVSIFF